MPVAARLRLRPVAAGVRRSAPVPTVPAATGIVVREVCRPTATVVHASLCTFCLCIVCLCIFPSIVGAVKLPHRPPLGSQVGPLALVQPLPQGQLPPPVGAGRGELDLAAGRKVVIAHPCIFSIQKR
jgi:hypothetical protein